VDALEAIKEIQTARAKIYFQQENIDSDNPDMQVTLAVYLVVAELENKSRSENIKWGMPKTEILSSRKMKKKT